MVDRGPPSGSVKKGVLRYGTNDLETLHLVNAAQLTPLAALRHKLPRDLEAICLKALSPSAADRYASAAAIAADLRRYLAGKATE